MKRTADRALFTFLAALTALALLAPTAPAQQATLDQRIAEGEKAVAAGNLPQAYTMFTQLLKEHPGDLRVNFHYGMTCYALKDFSRANLAFERVVAKNPKDGKSWVMLGLCEMATEQYNEARTHFQKALTLNPPDKDRKHIESYIQQAGRGRKRWNLAGRIDAGVFDDSNVNVGPNSDLVSIDPIIFGSTVFDELELEDESLPLAAEGLFTSVSLSTYFDAGKPGGWLVTAEGAYYENWMRDAADYQSLYVQGMLGLRRMGLKTALQMPVRAIHYRTGGNALLNMYGVVPSLLCAMGPMNEQHLITSATAEVRDYRTQDDRDSSYFAVSETLRHYFGKSCNSLSLGITMDRDMTDAPQYDYTGVTWNFGLTMVMPLSSTLYFRLKHADQDYDEKEALAPEKREDTQDQFTVGVSKRITSQWGLDANFQTTESDSTFKLYEYDRDLFTVSTFLTF